MDRTTSWWLVRLAGLPLAVERLDTRWSALAPFASSPGAGRSLEAACLRAVRR